MNDDVSPQSPDHDDSRDRFGRPVGSGGDKGGQEYAADDTRPFSERFGSTHDEPEQTRPQPARGDDYWAPSTTPGAAPVAVQQRPARRRTTLAAGVVAASLVLGGAAGLGGAALWDSLHDDSTTALAGSSAAQTSKVVDTGASSATDGSVVQVASAVLPSVVKIEVAGTQESGSGSGIILSSDGEILTNNHVVAIAGNGGSIQVDFNDGSPATATVLGTDPITDTAVIKADGVSGLTPATIGKSANLRVGQAVVAIGSPFGLDSTVTSGIVSALNRPVDVGTEASNNATVYPAIQTDAAINPGNSGGPLVDLDGTSSASTPPSRARRPRRRRQSGSIGLGFAIPIDEVLPIVDQMRQGETPTHARLGISVSDVQAKGGQTLGGASTAQLPSTDGAQVQEVTSGSTASGRRYRRRGRDHQGRRQGHQRLGLAGGDHPVLPSRGPGHRDLHPGRPDQDHPAHPGLRRRPGP